MPTRLLDFILADETYGFDKMWLYDVGHSLGGPVCGQLTGRRPELRGGVLLMPCDIGTIPLPEREHHHAYQTIREVMEESARRLNGTTGEALL